MVGTRGGMSNLIKKRGGEGMYLVCCSPACHLLPHCCPAHHPSLSSHCVVVDGVVVGGVVVVVAMAVAMVGGVAVAVGWLQLVAVVI